MHCFEKVFFGGRNAGKRGGKAFPPPTVAREGESVPSAEEEEERPCFLLLPPPLQ